MVGGFLEMSVNCNAICQRYKALLPKNMGRYTVGQKRCNSCEIFIYWDGLWCPCCNDRLRLSPRSSKNKEKFLKIKTSKREISNGM